MIEWKNTYLPVAMLPAWILQDFLTAAPLSVHMAVAGEFASSDMISNCCVYCLLMICWPAVFCIALIHNCARVCACDSILDLFLCQVLYFCTCDCSMSNSKIDGHNFPAQQGSCKRHRACICGVHPHQGSYSKAGLKTRGFGRTK